MLRSFALLLLLVLFYQDDLTPEATSEPSPTFPEPGSYTAREQYGDLERRYRIYIPAAYAERDEPAALVLVFHGAGGTGAWIESFSGFNELADEAGFVVIYPDGVNGAWNDGRQGDPRVGAVDDLAFVSDMLAYLRQTLDIDRVYATGYSMGGMFSFRLGCEMRDQISGVASVASTFPEYLLNTCRDTPPVPVIVLHGTDDPVVPWQGVRGGYLSAANSLTFWGLHNECQTASALEVLADLVTTDGTIVLRESQTDCTDDADVVLYGVYLGGHTWPGRPIEAPFELGNTTLDIDAAQIIWNFFND